MVDGVLDTGDVAAWVASHEALAPWVPVAEVTAIGDGNLNNVFRVGGRDGSSLVLKQGMPYVRIDPTWALTPTRIHHEAFAYATWAQVGGGIGPELYAFVPEEHAIAVEDLRDHRVWREALASGSGRAVGDARAVGGSVAAIAAETARRVDDPAWCERAANPEMTELMHDVLFRFPYGDHPHNRYHAGVAAAVADVVADEEYRDAVRALQVRWTTGPQALIHGDLHTGSVMVGPGGPRLIDAEFSTVGPVAWDVGELLGNLLCAGLAAEDPEPVEALAVAFWDGFASGPFPVTDALRADAIGYAGIELVRRVIGSGKADEVEALESARHVAVAGAMLEAGRSLALGRASLTVPDAVAVVRAAR